jgi:hypothetical protein
MDGGKAGPDAVPQPLGYPVEWLAVMADPLLAQSASTV